MDEQDEQTTRPIRLHVGVDDDGLAHTAPVEFHRPDEEADTEEVPRIDATPGEFTELTEMVHGRLTEIGDRIHQQALLARFLPIDFVIHEAGIYVRVRRDNDPGGWFVWRAIVFSTREQIVPDVIGVYEDRDEALQAASDTVDRLLKEIETDDTQLIKETPS